MLKPSGTCWLNLGDSYAGSWGAQSRPASMDDDIYNEFYGLSGQQIAAERPEGSPAGTGGIAGRRNSQGRD